MLIADALCEKLAEIDKCVTNLILQSDRRVAAEREACAKIAEERTMFLSCSPDGHGIAKAIRERQDSK